MKQGHTLRLLGRGVAHLHLKEVCTHPTKTQDLGIDPAVYVVQCPLNVYFVFKNFYLNFTQIIFHNLMDPIKFGTNTLK